jgi:hypothetical protein
MTEDEIARLAVLVSEVPQVPPPLPRYATKSMPVGITEEEALERVLRNSAPHTPPPPPPPFNQWAVPASPPAAPTYVLTAANWPLEVPELVILDDDDE